MNLRYTLRARTRVSPGRSPEVTTSRSIHQVIPGSAVRGAIASAWARDHEETWGAASPRFVHLFEGDGVFGQAVPAGARLEPMSWRQCKYPGEKCRTTWTDLAWLVLQGEDPPPRCPTCQTSWKAGRGWRLGAPGAVIGTIGTAQRNSSALAAEANQETATTRAALDEHGVARTGKLFTRRALGAGTILTGRLVLPGGVDDESREWFSRSHGLRLGGQRSVLGSVEWSADQVDSDPGDNPPRAVLVCESPALLIDEYGAPSLDLGAHVTQLLGPSVSVEARWHRPVRVAGWHAASGLPKPEEWALEAGSTVVLDGLPHDAAKTLAAGIGMRRNEGYGMVRLYWEDPTPPPVSRIATPTAGGVGPAIPDVAGSASGVDALLRGIRSLPDRQSQRAGLSGLERDLSDIARLRARGEPPEVVDAAVTGLLAQPWTRDLPGGARHELEAIVRVSDPDTLDAALAAIRRERQ